MAEYPADMVLWRERTKWLERDFITGPNSTREALKEMVHFANGDSSGTKVVHYCLLESHHGRPCCESDEEALGKMLSHAIQFYPRGFQTPLLYRMKHYGQASSYVKFGCAFFALLPQALQVMSSSEASIEATSLADALLAESDFQGVETNILQALQDAVDMDANLALQNKVRRQLVVEEISQPRFLQNCLIIDALIHPIEHGINSLLKHTQLLHQLRYLGRGHHPESDQVKEQTSKLFLDVIQGSLCDRLVKNYLQFLKDGLKETIQMGLDPRPELLTKVFQLVTICVTDDYRRFKCEFLSSPFTWFSLLSLDTEGFVQSFSTLQTQHCRCNKCTDPDFGRILLEHFSSDIRSSTPREQYAIQSEVCGLLQDIAEWCPLTSDSVELRNGQAQWVISRRGGQSIKAPRAAAEDTILHSAIKQHSWSLESESNQSLPPKTVSSGILKMVGVSVDKAGPGGLGGAFSGV